MKRSVFAYPAHAGVSPGENEMGDKPFGTLLDVYQTGYECIGHSMRPVEAADPTSFRITIGGADCRQPYSASIFNISAMSFGALSANAIRALNLGAAKGNFYHDTGEGSISRYHRENNGDLVWELGSGYFGCRSADGHFDPRRFAEQAQSPQVKMIEIKLSRAPNPATAAFCRRRRWMRKSPPPAACRKGSIASRRPRTAPSPLRWK